MTLNHEVKSVIFETCDESGLHMVEVPLDEALDYGTAHNARAQKVTWADGGWSWAKSWNRAGSTECVRIGAGAYGDQLVARA